MKNLSFHTAKLFTILLIALLTGCAVPLKDAIYRDPGLSPDKVGDIQLLPPIDLRLEKTQTVDLNDSLRDPGMKMMQKKGYKVTLNEELGDVMPIIEDDLRSNDPKWISRLGPSDQRWVMVLALMDLKSKVTFGSTGNAEVSGYLYDKEKGVIVWRDKGIGQAGQGGLIGMAMVGMMAGQALNIAMNNLMASVPNLEEQVKTN